MRSSIKRIYFNVLSKVVLYNIILYYFAAKATLKTCNVVSQITLESFIVSSLNVVSNVTLKTLISALIGRPLWTCACRAPLGTPRGPPLWTCACRAAPMYWSRCSCRLEALHFLMPFAGTERLDFKRIKSAVPRGTALLMRFQVSHCLLCALFLPFGLFPFERPCSKFQHLVVVYCSAIQPILLRLMTSRHWLVHCHDVKEREAIENVELF